MTLKQIKDNADMAETYPESGVLNWGEISFETLSEWVRLNPRQKHSFTEDFDVESVKSMFYELWKEQGAGPTIDEQMTACLNEKFEKMKKTKDAIKACAYCGENDGCDLFKKKHSHFYT